MKMALAFLVAAGFLAGVAHAQPPTPPDAAAATAAPPPGATVSGVTVRAAPRKPCAPKDADCIAIVMAQVKELYPEQLKTFCYQQKMDVMQRDMQANMAGWCDDPKRGAAAICNHYVSPVVKKVCAPDPPADKADARK